MITLFYTVAKKYESVLPRSLARHVNLCQTPIKKIFLILHPEIDKNKLVDSINRLLPYSIDIDSINDDQAIETLNYFGTKYEKVVRDKHYLQQMYKLHIDILSGEDRIVVADADGLILNPVTYLENDKDIIYIANDQMINYEFANEFFNFPAALKYDFITEKMLFNSKILKDFRSRYDSNFLQFTESRHNWYDLSQEDYNFFKGASYPSEYQSWELLPPWVQEELKTFLTDEITPTKYAHIFSEYQLYGTFAYHFYQNEVVFKPTKVQSGPFNDQNEEFDVFINRDIKGGTIGAFEYVYQKYNK